MYRDDSETGLTRNKWAVHAGNGYDSRNCCGGLRFWLNFKMQETQLSARDFHCVHIVSRTI